MPSRRPRKRIGPSSRGLLPPENKVEDANKAEAGKDPPREGRDRDILPVGLTRPMGGSASDVVGILSSLAGSAHDNLHASQPFSSRLWN